MFKHFSIVHNSFTDRSYTEDSSVTPSKIIRIRSFKLFVKIIVSNINKYSKEIVFVQLRVMNMV